MTAIVPERSAVPGPALTAVPGAGAIIAALFAVTVALFLLGLLVLALPVG